MRFSAVSTNFQNQFYLGLKVKQIKGVFLKKEYYIHNHQNWKINYPCNI